MNRFAIMTLVGLFTTLSDPFPSAASPRGHTTTREVNMDRPGADYRGFDLSPSRPELCAAACHADPQCAAYTFVRPGVQGPAARCYLKSSVPEAKPSACCISGVILSAAPTPESDQGLEYETDRAGSDYRGFDMSESRPELCAEACRAEAQCAAFTFVRAGVQGPSPRCYLKSGIPSTTANANCVSGVVRGVTAPPTLKLEYETDRAGADYRGFDLGEDRPSLCADACRAEAQCAAFTFVRAGVHGPSPRCYLKSSVPTATPNPVCVSGVKR